MKIGLSLIIEIIIQPVPVPISKIFLEVISVILNISSTINSVSGLGINTFY